MNEASHLLLPIRSWARSDPLLISDILEKDKNDPLLDEDLLLTTYDVSAGI